MWIWKKIIKPGLEWIGHFQTVQTIIYTEFFRTLFLPTVWTVLTAIAGYVGDFPIMWIMVATAVSFMAVTQTLLRADELRERKNPQNKLKYLPIFQCDLNIAPMALSGNRLQKRAQRSQPQQTISATQLSPQVSRTLDKGQIGVEIVNHATFPISAYLQNAVTEIEGITPPRSTFPKPAFLIPAGGTVRICDDRIELDEMPCQRLAGKIDLVIKYGLPGKEHFDLCVKGGLDIIMEHFGFVSAVIISLA